VSGDKKSDDDVKRYPGDHAAILPLALQLSF